MELNFRGGSGEVMEWEVFDLICVWRILRWREVFEFLFDRDGVEGTGLYYF